MSEAELRRQSQGIGGGLKSRALAQAKSGTLRDSSAEGAPVSECRGGGSSRAERDLASTDGGGFGRHEKGRDREYQRPGPTGPRPG